MVKFIHVRYVLGNGGKKDSMVQPKCLHDSIGWWLIKLCDVGVVISNNLQLVLVLVN
jgi:hypothetical protein